MKRDQNKNAPHKQDRTMIEIKHFVCNAFQENCYIASDETKEAVVIDCGALYEEESAAIATYIHDNKLKPVHLLATHGHIDHNFGNRFIFNEYKLKVEVNARDKQLMEHLPEQAKTLCGLTLEEELPPVGLYLPDSGKISFGNHTLQILHTPGHSPGSVFFVCEEEKLVFSGDTLFRHSIGRTDFYFGSFDDIMESLHSKVAKLPAETVVLPGHGPQTTIGHELSSNPYLTART